jgi:gliding motility-associated-like protein
LFSAFYSLNASAQTATITSFTDTICVDEGCATVSITGGTAPYDYTWYDATNGSIFSVALGSTADTNQLCGLIPRDYYCVVTSGGNSYTSDTITIASDFALNTWGSTMVSCSYNCDAFLNAINLSYSYVWASDSNLTNVLSTTASVSNLCAGITYVEVDNNDGCVHVFEKLILSPTPVDVVTNSHSNVSCNGLSDGAIDISASGGVGALSYEWQDATFSTVATTEDLNNQSAGTYYLLISDNNCIDTTIFTLTEPAVLGVSLDSSTGVSCSNTNDGYVYTTISGGTTNYNINWTGPGAFTSSNEDLPALYCGDYQMVVTDANSCTDTLSISFPCPLPVDITLDSVDHISCFGAQDGAAYTTVSGGTSSSGNYTLSWNTNPPTASEDLLNIMSSGAYTLTATDDNNCTSTLNVLINEPGELAVDTLSITDATCYNTTDGLILTQTTGGTMPFSYEWTNFAGSVVGTTPNLSEGGGIYDLTVTDANNCQATLQAIIQEPAQINISLNTYDISCNGANDGAIQATASGGAGGFTYSWSGPTGFTSANDSIFGLAPGIYYLTVTDAVGCNAYSNDTIIEPGLLSISTTVSNVSCLGLQDGNITANVSGGTAPFSYSWFSISGNAYTGAFIDSLPADSYDLEVTDANGCNEATTVLVGQPSNPLTATSNVTTVSCFGGSDGSITLTPAGGTSPYSFSWSDGQTTAQASNLVAGSYIGTITDGNGCTTIDTISLGQPDEIAANLTQSPENCNQLDGQITANPTGGVGGYSYNWISYVETSNVLSNLDGGTGNPVLVIITDNNNCSHSASLVVQETQALTLDSATIKDVECFESNDAWAIAHISGGNLPYTYQWFDSNNVAINPVKTQDSLIFNVPAGTYKAFVTDASNCSDTFYITIVETQSAGLTATIKPGQSNLSLNCFGDNDGIVALNVTGGTPFPGPHYEYTVNGVPQSQWTPTITGLTGGAYEIVINDAVGCYDTVSGVIAEPAALATNLTQTAVNCYGGSDGEVTAVVTGGAPAYTFNWSTGFSQVNSSSSTILSLAANTYSLVVEDNNGCLDTASIVVTAPAAPLDLSLSSTKESCQEEDGTATVSVQGGTPNYTYYWSYDLAGAQPIYTSNNILNPSAYTSQLQWVYSGTYYVQVTDANGCVSNDSIFIDKATNPELHANPLVHPECFGYSTGEISVYTTGGTPLYDYSLNSSAYTANQVFSNLNAGVHFITVRDLLGCTDTISLELIEPSAVQASDMIVTNATCNGFTDGSIEAVITGGTLAAGNDYTYQWFNPNGGPAFPANLSGITSTLTGIGTGTYSINVYDDNNCSYTTSATVNEPFLVEGAATVTSSYNGADVSCFGSCDGAIIVTPAGGTPPYSYQWLNTAGVDTSQTVDSLCAGTYEVIITDAENCTNSNSITVTVTEPMDINATIDPADVNHVKCEGWSTGDATVSVSGGLMGINTTYYWYDVNDPATALSVTNTMTDQPIGTYNVLVTDMNGCTDETSVVINDDDKLAFAATNNTTDVTCFGFNDGIADVNPINGVPPYLHLWDDPLAQQTREAVGLMPGTYTDVVRDAEGCIIIGSTFVGEPTELVIANTVVNEISCFNADDASIQIIANGGTPGYQYSANCNNFNSSSVISNLSAGTYTLCVKDANGCETSVAGVTVAAQPAELVITNFTYSDISCHGEDDGSASVTVNGGTPNYDYTWSLGNNSNSTSNLTPGQHQVVITDDNGCTVTKGFTVVEPSQIVIDSIIIDNYCAYALPNNDAVATVYALGGTGTLTYYANNVSSPDYEVNNLSVGMYTIKVQDDNGCFVETPIHVEDPNLIDFHSATICLGDTITMNGASLHQNFHTYVWSVDTGLVGADTILNASPSESSSYLVLAWDNGCYSLSPFSDTIPVTVNVPNVSVGEDIGIIRGEDAVLTVSDEPFYLWSTGETTQSITVEPLTTTYYVGGAIDDENGCFGTDTIRVFVGMNDAFSPNGDGYNDDWELGYLNQYEGAKVEVFNRWGAKLWSSEAPNIENWNGQHKGSDLPMGSYYYVITFAEAENKEPLSGPVTIVR